MNMRYLLIVWLLMAFPYACNTMGPEASMNDGSCTYDLVWVAPYKTIELSEVLTETSGLILWEGLLWTHNDDSDNRLYGLDTATAKIKKTHILWKTENKDWEEIAQDEGYIYIGDFGNNSGDRKDLHILRVEKNSLKTGKASIDTIWFSYSDQHQADPAGLNQTEFDCEAFVVSSDSIYLFTKQWLSGNTTLYAMSKEPGEHVAEKQSSFNIEGLVTGATFLERERLLVLCGYSGLSQPFLHLFYDYPGNDFFIGNKRRVNVSLLFHQIEGVATEDGLKYYLSNEYSSLESAGYVNPQKLHMLDLGPYLQEYLEGD